MQWYYIVDGNQTGPVEEQEFFQLAKEGKLKPSDMVWNETMGQEWVKASTVSGLLDSAKAPPLPPLPPQDPAFAASESEEMGESEGGAISCVVPVDPAWKRMVGMLFKPFNMGKWFVLGFTAWLATLGESQGGFSMPGGSGSSGTGGGTDFTDLEGTFESVQGFFSEHGEIILLVGAIAVFVGLALSVLMVWLRARGRFMFLDNVAQDRALVAEPWRRFARRGNSLFLWDLGFSVVCLAVVLLLLALTYFRVIRPCVTASGWVSSVVPGIVVIGLLWLIFGITAGYVRRFLYDFVVPIMYKHDLGALDAWRRFLPLLKSYPGSFVLYGVFYVVLGVAAGMAVGLFVIITCCTAGCLMAIPYIGAVVVLPVTVFFRAYSLEYLGQFGEAYVLFEKSSE